MFLNSTFVFMKNRYTISLLFLANIISGFAQGISMVAIPWYFVKVADNAEYFANSYLLITFLTLFWGIYAGTLVDRYSRKKLFIIINVVCGILIGAVAYIEILKSYLKKDSDEKVFAHMIKLQKKYWPEAKRSFEPIDIEYLSCECRKYYSYVNGTKLFEGRNLFYPKQ